MTRIALRRKWAALLATAAIWMILGGILQSTAQDTVLEIVSSGIVTAVVLWALLRHGVLGAAVLKLVVDLNVLARTVDWTAWHSVPSWLALIATAALAVAGAVAARPFHLERRGRNRLLVTLGIAAGLFVAREEIRDEVQKRRDPDRTDVYNAGRDVMGKAWLAPALAAGFWTASYATDDPRERETAFMLLESAAFSSTGAALTAYQRLDADKHWAPDAFLGVAAGLAVGRNLCRLHADASSDERESRVDVAWYPGGVRIRW